MNTVLVYGVTGNLDIAFKGHGLSKQQDVIHQSHLRLRLRLLSKLPLQSSELNGMTAERLRYCSLSMQILCLPFSNNHESCC